MSESFLIHIIISHIPFPISYDKYLIPLMDIPTIKASRN